MSPRNQHGKPFDDSNNNNKGKQINNARSRNCVRPRVYSAIAAWFYSVCVLCDCRGWAKQTKQNDAKVTATTTNDKQREDCDGGVPFLLSSSSSSSSFAVVFLYALALLYIFRPNIFICF